MEVTHFKKASTDADTRDTLSRMERDWDARAREAPEQYIASAHRQWRMDEFFQSGQINVDNYILADAEVICRGKKLSQMRVLEIGCGAGRMTRALAASFGEVHAVDISTEMIALAKRNLSDLRNVFLHKNNGIDLSEFPDQSLDFAFSFIVFQHIPSLIIIAMQMERRDPPWWPRRSSRVFPLGNHKMVAHFAEHRSRQRRGNRG